MIQGGHYVFRCSVINVLLDLSGSDRGYGFMNGQGSYEHRVCVVRTGHGGIDAVHPGVGFCIPRIGHGGIDGKP
ncbi:hypothetical protein D9M69_693540 [compost metagenome]